LLHFCDDAGGGTFDIEAWRECFLDRRAGSGKTHTINRYIAWLRERSVEPSVTASTGIAATHVNGMTIHSWSGIGIKKNVSDWDVEQIASRERQRAALSMPRF